MIAIQLHLAPTIWKTNHFMRFSYNKINIKTMPSIHDDPRHKFGYEQLEQNHHICRQVKEQHDKPEVIADGNTRRTLKTTQISNHNEASAWCILTIEIRKPMSSYHVLSSDPTKKIHYWRKERGKNGKVALRWCVNYYVFSLIDPPTFITFQNRPTSFCFRLDSGKNLPKRAPLTSSTQNWTVSGSTWSFGYLKNQFYIVWQ